LFCCSEGASLPSVAGTLRPKDSLLPAQATAVACAGTPSDSAYYYFENKINKCKAVAVAVAVVVAVFLI